ncbi:MAG: prepilin peptidase [Bacteriovoracia bacterium]
MRFGATETYLVAIVLISLIALATDVARGKIYNWLTLPALLLGIAVSASLAGWSGASDSLLGAGAGLLLFGWIFWLGFMGAGDVKLLMALGAWGGLAYTADVAVFSVAVGAVIAFFVLLFKGRLPDFFYRVSAPFMALFNRGFKFRFPEIDRRLRMPFGIPIAVAAVWVAVDNPVARLGLDLWR